MKRSGQRCARVFTFAVPRAGDYVIRAQVDAPDESANSFYVSMDGEPEDPSMIWDVKVTDGFEERVVSWRGSGSMEDNEIVPKVFNLSVGEHRLVLVGREPGKIKELAVVPYVPPAPVAEGSWEDIQQRYERTDANYRRQIRALPDNETGEKEARELREKVNAEHAQQFIEAVTLAERNSAADTGLAALQWVLSFGRAHYQPAGRLAVLLLSREYSEHPGVGTAVASVAWWLPYEDEENYAAAVDLLRHVASSNPDRTARGQAALGLAYLPLREFKKAEARGTGDLLRA